MRKYTPREIEGKWQKTWQDSGIYQAKDFDKKQKYVMLTEFPYPSGDGLHLGHTREYTLGDIMARYKRMHGYNVLYPMGYDAFGLPTENYAIKNKITPQKATDVNVSNFQKQFESLGFSIDWSRSFRTSDPDYYKWTQWLFLQFFKHGLAYQDEISINWCPKCKTGLANEEVINGKHERCDHPVEKKQLKQWLLKITKYADRLIEGLDHVDYPKRIAEQQINWIGKSKGAEIDFAMAKSGNGGQELGNGVSIKVFTTRPDTLFGATFMVLAPEHPLVSKITTKEHRQKINDYIKQAQAKSDIERQDTDREKTGVFTGAYAINPANKEKIPIWIADYVLYGYGTGAIMAVPAHDERDNEFAKRFRIPIKQVIAERFIDENSPHRDGADLVPRQVVTVLVKHPEKAEYIIAKPAKGSSWSPLMGGIDEGETPEEAAKRELLEETGYNDVKSAKWEGQVFASEFYADHKDLNRIAYCHVVMIELASLNKDESAAKDKNEQEIKWVTEEEYKSYPANGGFHEVFKIAHGKHTDMVFEGRIINSGKYNGSTTDEMREKIVSDLQKKGVAKEVNNYRLRDWIFSRQHYWGEPIPVIHCQECGAVPVPEKDLPIELPKVDNYEPTDTGESPLAAIEDWVNTTCPKCKKPAKRETDTMPNWAGSSWYYLRYFDAKNDKVFADDKKLNYWGSVDMYLGGMEHTTLHLLYSRFWHQFFYDIGLVPTPEPYVARRGQGIILAADGSKMSKSKGNVVNPNDILDDGYGADALRLSIAFLAPFDMTTPWNPEGVVGTYRFLNRAWNVTQEYLETKSHQQTDSKEDARLLQVTHKAIKKVTVDLHEMGFNTAIATLMQYVNELYKIKDEKGFANQKDWQFACESLALLLAPFAPHIAEELWQELGQEGSVHLAKWPEYDEGYLVDHVIKIAVQVNGKLRGEIEVEPGTSKEIVVQEAKNHSNVKAHLIGEPKKVIYVLNKLINLVSG